MAPLAFESFWPFLTIWVLVAILGLLGHLGCIIGHFKPPCPLAIWAIYYYTVRDSLIESFKSSTNETYIELQEIDAVKEQYGKDGMDWSNPFALTGTTTDWGF